MSDCEIRTTYERFSAAVDPSSYSEAPSYNSWASGLELELPQMLRHTLNWPAFRQELKISSLKVLNNRSSMARKGEGGCYRNLSSNMLLFAHGPLLIDFHLQEQKTN